MSDRLSIADTETQMGPLLLPEAGKTWYADGYEELEERLSRQVATKQPLTDQAPPSQDQLYLPA